MAMGECIELGEGLGIGEAGEFGEEVRGTVGLEFLLSGKELLGKGVQPGARGWELGGAVDEGEGEPVVGLDEDRGGEAVGPLGCRGRVG